MSEAAPSDHRTPPAWLRRSMRAATSVVRGLGAARYPLADAGAMTVYAAQRRRARRTAANHRRSAPWIGPREARLRARRSFRAYGRTSVDFLWANAMDDAEVLRCSRVVGLEHIRASQAAGRGGVLALAHFGTWDMAANIAVAHGLALTTVMAPMGPRAITDLVAWARQRNRLEVFTPQQAARGLLRALRANDFVALLSDIPGGGPTVVVDYCGGPVAFSTVPAWLAARTGAALLPVDCFRVSGGWQITVHPAVPVGAAEGHAEIMQRVASQLEREVRRRPGQWYPFGAVYADRGQGAARRPAAPAVDGPAGVPQR